MPTKLRWFCASLFLLGACKGEPKKVHVAPNAPPHHTKPAKPESLPATMPTSEAAVKVLNDLLASGDQAQQLTAVQAWANIEGPASTEALRTALYNKDPIMHTIAAAALVQRGDDVGLPLIEEALQGKDLGAAGLAVTALRRLDPPKAMPILQGCMSPDNVGLFVSCAVALAFLGDKPAEEQLQNLVKSPNTAASLARNVRFLPEPLSLSLFAALLEQDQSYQQAWVLAVVSSNRWGQGTIPLLRKALALPDPLTKGAAAAMLLARGEDADPNLVIGALADPNGGEIFSIIAERIKKPDARLWPAVNIALRGPSSGMPFAFQALDRLLQNKFTPTDLSALYALLDAVPDLTGKAPSPTPSKPKEPATVPSASSSAPSSAPTSKPIETAIEVSEQEAAQLRAKQGAAILAAAYLAILNDPRGVSTFTALLAWPNPNPSWIPAIEALRGDAAFPLILLAAKHNASSVRAAAAHALAAELTAGRKEAHDPLLALGTDEAPEVRQAVLLSLSLFSATEIDPVVRAALIDPLYALRVTAAVGVLSRGKAPAPQDE